jgi:hypothetical protein
LNYKKIYDALVEKARLRGLDKSQHEGYFEIHHIVPRSVGGSNDTSNLVMFTGREHYIAHMLLWKANPGNRSLMRAAKIMSSRVGKHSRHYRIKGKISSKVYEKLRSEYSEAVKAQCAGEGNPFYGKTHGEDTVEKMVSAKRRYFRKKSLLEWEKNNDKYMQQYVYELKPTPYVAKVRQDYKLLNAKYDKSLWYKAEAIKSYWERSGKPEAKLLSTELSTLTGYDVSYCKLRTIVDKFNSGWEPSEDTSFIDLAISEYSDHKESLDLFIYKTSKTLSEIKRDYFTAWCENREEFRSLIEDYIIENGVEKHKNNSMAKLSVTDVIEACLLWNSGLVEQKQIAELFGVARNSVSNAMEAEGRWISAREAAKNIKVLYFEQHNCPIEQTPRIIPQHARLG